jgi:hypothetical protein
VTGEVKKENCLGKSIEEAKVRIGLQYHLKKEEEEGEEEEDEKNKNLP